MRLAGGFSRDASEAGRLEPGDELTFSGMTCVKLRNPADKSVSRVARGGDLAALGQRG